MTLAVESTSPSLTSGGGFRVLRLALRELRTGISGFYVFLACVALGVMVITGVGALTDSLRNGLTREGALLLGGDISFARVHTAATTEERTTMEALGRVSEIATLRTMARLTSGDDQTFVVLKGVDGAYPLVGDVTLGDERKLSPQVLQGPTVAVDPIILERLQLKIGDRLKVGEAELKIVATIAKEPDGLTNGRTFGPRAMVSRATLQSTGLVKPGAMVRWRYAIDMNSGGDAALDQQRKALQKRFGEAGFTVKDRRDPSPQISRTLERLRQFLTLIGLTALLVGGVGVANAVATFVDRRRKVIATFKSLGATSGQVFSIFLVQVLIMAAIGIAIGVIGGFIIPLVLEAIFGDALPVKAQFSVSWGSVLAAVTYGFLVALLFILWPLGRAELISPAVLFRDDVADTTQWPRPAIVVLSFATALTLCAFAVLTSDSMKIALAFCVGLTAIFAIFLALGTAVRWVARKLPRAKTPELALALGNLGAPGGLTRSVVLSLGAGLSLLIAVALANSSLVEELSGRLPENSPDYFLLDINKAEYDGLAGLVQQTIPKSHLENAPMLRGRLVKLGGTPVEELKAPPEARWVLNGDRGLTYSDNVPEGSKVVAGEWWGADYNGPPLVSFEVDLARKLGVGIGDTVTVNVLGRTITAKISNLRELNWENLTINFVMVFTPTTLKGAPHNLLATVRLPDGSGLGEEAKLSRALAKSFPGVTTIRVKDAIKAFNDIFKKVMSVIQVAGSVTLIAGALVLAGALATAQRRRILEAVILKALGATRRRILTAHLIEYLLLAAMTSGVAILLGSIAAWFALTQVMDVGFMFSLGAVLQSLVLSVGLILAFGGYGTLKVLNARPVPYLRAE
ncbi:MAG: ABC transporter permease [Hyphomicrobiaceae bacterium]